MTFLSPFSHQFLPRPPFHITVPYVSESIQNCFPLNSPNLSYLFRLLHLYRVSFVIPFPTSSIDFLFHSHLPTSQFIFPYSPLFLFNIPLLKLLFSPLHISIYSYLPPLFFCIHSFLIDLCSGPKAILVILFKTDISVTSTFGYNKVVPNILRSRGMVFNLSQKAIFKLLPNSNKHQTSK